ncbi:hypothetical protein BpHYR1_048264 [Brachionus plicatilis]|uniref:Uncharacterized protein n=1 Tax=Brachionus plicatilis TaxID=10195 RepID=A0A3M7RSX7_BRAPC|nr:hypothetical protein BpHYR1_048264 [Brachionus plicatilis]
MSGINRDLIGQLKIVYKWEVSSEVLFTKVTKRWRFSRYRRSKRRTKIHSKLPGRDRLPKAKSFQYLLIISEEISNSLTLYSPSDSCITFSPNVSNFFSFNFKLVTDQSIKLNLFIFLTRNDSFLLVGFSIYHTGVNTMLIGRLTHRKI